MIGVSQVGPNVKGAGLPSFLTEGHLEVLNGHHLPGSFAPPVSSPVETDASPIAPYPVLLSLGCDWCGIPCGSSAFCSPRCRRLFAGMAPAVLADEVPDYDFLDAMGDDEF